MSSILLSNPFVTPAPLAQPPGAAAQSALAVAPSQAATDTGKSGDANAFSGNGSGFGSSEGAQTLIRLSRTAAGLERPFEATSVSVVNAQAQDTEGSPNPFGTNLPGVDMPDPLPTSPYLKRN